MRRYRAAVTLRSRVEIKAHALAFVFQRERPASGSVSVFPQKFIAREHTSE
jgi:hypothetical protein